MNKVYGEKGIYAPIRKDENRTIACYGYIEEEDGINATWYEIVFYNFKTPHLNFQMVKNAIVADINAQTDEKILNGYEWTILHGNDAGKTVKVWLSAENQNNFKAFHDAVKEYPGIDAFPVTFKIAEDENGDPVYETFMSMSELSQFYLGSISYIKQTISKGWERKDSIDWSIYETVLEGKEDLETV